MMLDMFTSEATTRGVRVQVLSRYSPERSQPFNCKWFFLYTVTISNESSDTVQLLTRHWVVTDGTQRAIPGGKVEPDKQKMVAAAGG